MAVVNEVRRGVKFNRVLAFIVAGGLIFLGFAELVVRLDDPSPLLFWLPTLWGGAALIIAGKLGLSGKPKLKKPFVILGGLLGLIPSAWTVIMPILIITLVIGTLIEPKTLSLTPS